MMVTNLFGVDTQFSYLHNVITVMNPTWTGGGGGGEEGSKTVAHR